MSATQSSETAEASVPYRVLARKYRPQSLADLIGQEPMVRTLTNAFETGRIAQAYLLTGVRGVGKTSTARILARALNYTKAGTDRPSIDFSEIGEHCTAIMEGRHIDVIEMDAASHTGIGDIREIIEAVRYKPAAARYKVYIIDEVHMLSNQAFNGLLKTLEEPPEHVKFIFATTEVRKVPVTVLSRCQRFDLRRIEAGRLVALLEEIAAKENVAIDHDALAMIARAAEGSARDALSLLDQAIAHSTGEDGAATQAIKAGEVRAMLGLADRNRVIDLFDQLMRGEVASALGTLGGLYESGADPATVLEDLANFTHVVTRLKLTPETAQDTGLTEEERDRGRNFAEALSIRLLSRCWQILLKGIDEAREASQPLAAAEMVLVRLAHSADLPTPDEAIRVLTERSDDDRKAAAAPPLPVGQKTPALTPAPSTMQPQPARSSPVNPAAIASLPAEKDYPKQEVDAASNAVRIERFENLIALAGEKRDLQLKFGLERFVRLIRLEPGRIQLGLTEDAPASFTSDLGNRLHEWTGRRWIITIDSDANVPTLFEREATARAQLVKDASRDPTVAAVLERFPGSEIVDIRFAGGDAKAGAGAEISNGAADVEVPPEGFGD